jgi:hypothetical protein
MTNGTINHFPKRSSRCLSMYSGVKCSVAANLLIIMSISSFTTGNEQDHATIAASPSILCTHHGPE